jgi:hypothetical protein
MAREIHDVTVTVKHKYGKSVYTAPQGTLSGFTHSGKENHTISLLNSTRNGVSTEGFSIDFIKAPEQEDERKKLIKSHASVLTDVLKAAETTKLNSAIKRERMEQEIAAQERADRIAMMFAVNNAIQAGLSEEEVTAGMCDGWASYVCDMYGHVYTATDLDTVVNKK